jgi:hypothetical protein
VGGQEEECVEAREDEAGLDLVEGPRRFNPDIRKYQESSREGCSRGRK